MSAAELERFKRRECVEEGCDGVVEVHPRRPHPSMHPTRNPHRPNPSHTLEPSKQLQHLKRRQRGLQLQSVESELGRIEGEVERGNIGVVE